MKSQGVNRYLAEAAYVAEADVLHTFRRVDDPHLIKVLTTFQRGNDEFFFMFEWGSRTLGELFNTDPERRSQQLSAEDVLWAIRQLEGLAGALDKLHNLGTIDEANNDLNCRHGDLKPGNILFFEDSDGGQGFGRLVIADVGLGKVHNDATGKRRDSTINMTGTMKYEPPDTILGGARSRAYDIWSFGCICLELVVWLLYGPEGLKRFNVRPSRDDKYWSSPREVELRAAFAVRRPDQNLLKLVRENMEAVGKCHLRDEVRDWIAGMRFQDTRCAESNALGTLVKLVEDRLLAIQIGEPRQGIVVRAKAEELHRTISSIRQNAEAHTDSVFLTHCTGKPPTFVGSFRPIPQGLSAANAPFAQEDGADRVRLVDAEGAPTRDQDSFVVIAVDVNPVRCSQRLPRI